MNKKPKQIAAILCILLLVLLYLATLVVAILDFPGSDRLFAACLMATVGLPILLWLYIWAYGRFSRKKTMADLFPEAEGTVTDETHVKAASAVHTDGSDPNTNDSDTRLHD